MGREGNSRPHSPFYAPGNPAHPSLIQPMTTAAWLDSQSVSGARSQLRSSGSKG